MVRSLCTHDRLARPQMLHTVSVIIPTVCRPALLWRAIASVRSQTYPNVEIIVVVDGADAATIAALGQVEEPRMRVLRNPVRLGAGTARNAGAEVATGEWIAFLDDDDEWMPEKLERQLAGRSVNDAVLLSCRCRVENADGIHLWPQRIYDGTNSIDDYLFDRTSMLRGDVYLATPTLLMPRWLFAKCRFGDTEQDEDTTLLLRATKQFGARVVMVPEPLVVIHENPTQSLGFNFDWRQSLEWADSMQGMITPRAYSGYCLVVLGSQAARHRDVAAVWVLLRNAFSRGRPRLMQLLLFGSFWTVPDTARRWVRSLATGMRRSLGH